MDVRHWDALQEAFNRLAEMHPADQERALQELYNTNPAIGAEVKELLEEDACDESLPELDIQHLLVDAVLGDELKLPVQSQIGPYRIVKFIGEGGMGVVYLAERTDISGFVAIKLLRDAWLSPVRRQRFAVEQQMLGLLNHPSIARIYDAGITRDGTPWFVMEFANGVNITEHFRVHPATAREKIRLFREVCETVRYAHSHAIIHRDLKPGNILVTEAGQIKLLDFGIAKQMDLVTRENSAATVGLRLFTPAYAAPELERDGRVGVFTDVYSLGVILYELLTGVIPLPDGRLADREAGRPSKAAAASGSSAELAISKSEWADIDAICMRALDPEPERRYRSMDVLIDDITAFLEYRPLSARKNAFIYSARKFVRRNRIPLLGFALALLVLLTSTILFTVRLERARDAAAKARDAAISEAARSERLQRFTESLFTAGQQSGVPAPQISVVQMLDRGRSEALALTGDPQLQTDMFRVLGSAYLYLRHYAAAEPLLLRAQQASCAAGRSLQCAQVERSLGDAKVWRGDPSGKGEALLRDALEIRQKNLPPNDPSIASVELTLGWALSARGDRNGAKELFTKALAIASAAGHPTPILADVMNAYGQFAFAHNDPRAKSYEERTAQLYKQFFGENSYEYGTSLFTLGTVAMNLGRYDQAEAYDRQTLASMRAWSGSDQVLTVPYMHGLAFVLSLQGKFPEAKALLTQSLSLLSHSGNAPDILTANAYFYLGFIELREGKLRAAESHFNSVLAMAQRDIPVTNANVQISRLGLADIYASRGEYVRSEQMARQALSSGRQEGDYGATASHAVLGHALLMEGKASEAEAELWKAYMWFKHDPKIRPHTIQTYQDLAEAQSRLGKPQDATRIRAELRAHPK